MEWDPGNPKGAYTMRREEVQEWIPEAHSRISVLQRMRHYPLPHYWTQSISQIWRKPFKDIPLHLIWTEEYLDHLDQMQTKDHQSMLIQNIKLQITVSWSLFESKYQHKHFEFRVLKYGSVQTWAMRWCCRLMTRDMAICMLLNTATTSSFLSSNDGAPKFYINKYNDT